MHLGPPELLQMCSVEDKGQWLQCDVKLQMKTLEFLPK